jgi:hypothetical protein
MTFGAATRTARPTRVGLGRGIGIEETARDRGARVLLNVRRSTLPARRARVGEPGGLFKFLSEPDLAARCGIIAREEGLEPRQDCFF